MEKIMMIKGCNCGGKRRSSGDVCVVGDDGVTARDAVFLVNSGLAEEYLEEGEESKKPKSKGITSKSGLK